MPLINCPECKAEISDKAESCPKCGNPMKGATVQIKAEPKKGGGCLKITLIIFVLLSVGYCASKMGTNTTPSSNSNSNLATGERTIGKGGFACKKEDDYDKLIGFSAQEDSEAFSKYLGTRIVTGECTMLKSGEKIYLESVGLGTLQIRRKGESDTYWTYREAVQ